MFTEKKRHWKLLSDWYRKFVMLILLINIHRTNAKMRLEHKGEGPSPYLRLYVCCCSRPIKLKSMPHLGIVYIYATILNAVNGIERQTGRRCFYLCFLSETYLANLDYTGSFGTALALKHMIRFVVYYIMWRNSMTTPVCMSSWSLTF
jgi:hypothetical protein